MSPFKSKWMMLVAFFCMLVVPFFMIRVDEYASSMLVRFSIQAVLVDFAYWLLRIIPGTAWAYFLLMILDKTQVFPGWGFMVEDRNKRFISMLIATLLGFGITDGLLKLYRLLLP